MQARIAQIIEGAKQKAQQLKLLHLLLKRNLRLQLLVVVRLHLKHQH